MLPGSHCRARTLYIDAIDPLTFEARGHLPAQVGDCGLFAASVSTAFLDHQRVQLCRVRKRKLADWSTVDQVKQKKRSPLPQAPHPCPFSDSGMPLEITKSLGRPVKIVAKLKPVAPIPASLDAGRVSIATFGVVDLLTDLQNR
jgi:hypothetical protein